MYWIYVYRLEASRQSSALLKRGHMKIMQVGTVDDDMYSVRSTIVL